MKLITICLFLAVMHAGAAEKPASPVNVTAERVALKGYDPVAYFRESKAVKGGDLHAFEWKGAKWMFVSKENRDAFAAAPEKYAPQYGGYCAWAVGHNYTADADPQAWKIIDGKLYLNYNKAVQEKWQPDAAKWIESADKNWPALHK